MVREKELEQEYEMVVQNLSRLGNEHKRERKSD